MTAAIKLNSHRPRRRDATRRSSSFACAPPPTKSRMPSAVKAINAMANKANKRDQASICLTRDSENPRSHLRSRTLLRNQIESRVKQIDAWSRLFALFAIALMALTALGMQLLVRGGTQARELLRRVASRRRGRCELSLIAAVIALVQQDKTLF